MSRGVLAIAGIALLLTGGAPPAVVQAQRVTPGTLDTASVRQARDVEKSPQVAAALGFVPGVGHLYAGEVNRGWLILATYWTSVALSRGGGRTDAVGKGASVVMIGTFVFSIADAANAAMRHNQRLRRQRASSDSAAARRDGASPSSPRS